MDLKKDQSGFSLIELIVVVGIVAIIAGLSFNMLGRLRYANAEKVARTLEGSISKLQANSMRKSGDEKPYMFIAPINGEYYYYISSKKDKDGLGDYYYETTMQKEGLKFGTGIEVFTETTDEDGNVTEHIVSSTYPMRICFNKDGSRGENCPEYFCVRRGAKDSSTTITYKITITKYGKLIITHN